MRTAPIIIAECGNNHEGNLDTALELLCQAKQAGADLVKFQAGTAEGFARIEELIPFYKKFELGLEGYKRLLEEGTNIGIPVFFSIWSKELEELRQLESWHKIPARQFNYENVMKYDSDKTFISIPSGARVIIKNGYSYKGIPLFVVPKYPTYDPRLGSIKVLATIIGKKVGYSDHTIGISSAITAVKEFGAVAVEKHFTLPELKAKSDFRDNIHSATPDEFAKMVEAVKNE